MLELRAYIDQQDLSDHRLPSRDTVEGDEARGVRYPDVAVPLCAGAQAKDDQQTKGENSTLSEAVLLPAKMTELAKGVYWARVGLPWSLDHINVYLFDEGDSWTLVDTGAQTSTGRAAWQALKEGPLGGKPIKRVIGTHLHPDHIGLAGDLVRQDGAEFCMTQSEYLLAKTLWYSGGDTVPDFEVAYLLRAGVAPETEPAIRAQGYGHYKRGVAELPEVYTRLEDGMLITLAGYRFMVVIGRGHSPEHACLYGLDIPLFIGGDQILPAITSNVSVHAREPGSNPLAHWLSSLLRLKGLPGDPLVLPSHGRVFYGLHSRIDALVAGHMRKLATLHAHCTQARTAIETFPALFRREIKGVDFYLGLGEALAHLNFLVSIGLMQKTSGTASDSYESLGTFHEEAALSALESLPAIALQPLGELFKRVPVPAS